MAKKALLTVDGAYHKVRKGLITIDGEYRKVRKAFLTVGGQYRPCWSGGELAYYGTITPMSVTRSGCSAAGSGEHALVFGSSAVVDAYDRHLTRSNPADLFKDVWNTTGRYNGAYFVIGGGADSSGGTNTVTAYNDDLTRFSAAALTVARCAPRSSAAVGGHTLIAGGVTQSAGGTYGYTPKNVDAYDRDLTRTNPSSLSSVRYFATGAATQAHALFAGGKSGENTRLATVDVYDAALTKTTAPGLTAAKENAGAVSGEGLALIAGGQTGASAVTNVVDAYTDDLVHSTLSNLSVARKASAGAHLGEYCLICGGENTSGAKYAATDVYDRDLIRTTGHSLSIARNTMEGAAVGDHAIIPGGYDNVTNVDAWTLV